MVCSTVVIRFPQGNRERLITVLNRCFVDPFSDNFETALAQENQLVDIVRVSLFTTRFAMVPCVPLSWRLMH